MLPLLWCLAHFIQESVRLNKPTVKTMKIATHREQNRKVFSINAVTPIRMGKVIVDTRLSEAIAAATQQHQDVLHLKSRFRKSL
jgi:hypothetical protein